jgi:hypothetical protein
VRATGQLRERVAGMRHKLGMIASGPIDRSAIAQLVAAQERAVELAAKSRRRLTAVEEADLEDALIDRMDELGVASGVDLAPAFVGAGLGVEWLDEVAESVQGGALEGPLRWMAYTVETENLMDEIEDATGRISTLVAAVKQYSYMDSASRQEVDLHTGLDSTVVMLGHKLAGVEVRREYDPDLPRVPAWGAELNQVWTNLIDNAADAMQGTGRLVLRTRRDGDDAVCVEVEDAAPASRRRCRAGCSTRSSPPRPRGRAAGSGSTAPGASSSSGTSARSTSRPGRTGPCSACGYRSATARSSSPRAASSTISAATSRSLRFARWDSATSCSKAAWGSTCSVATSTPLACSMLARDDMALRIWSARSREE